VWAVGKMYYFCDICGYQSLHKYMCLFLEGIILFPVILKTPFPLLKELTGHSQFIIFISKGRKGEFHINPYSIFYELKGFQSIK
jgi:hypothetical protein